MAAVEKAGTPLKGTPGEFTVQDIALLDEIAETILPETKTPGAKAAKTGAFMALMVTDCYSPAEQKVFRDGMRTVDDAARKAYSVSFMAATPQQRLAVLTALDQEQKRVMDAREAARKEGSARAGGSRGAWVPEYQGAGPLLSHDEGTRAARLLHLRSRLHRSIALRRSAWALRSLHSLHARRASWASHA